MSGLVAGDQSRQRSKQHRTPHWASIAASNTRRNKFPGAHFLLCSGLLLKIKYDILLTRSGAFPHTSVGWTKQHDFINLPSSIHISISTTLTVVRCRTALASQKTTAAKPGSISTNMASPLRNLPALSLDAAKIANEAAQAKAKQMGIGQ